MIDTGHVGAASDTAEATQRIATIVAYTQVARHFLDLPPPDLNEVRQALDCIVTNACLASDVIHRIRGLRFFKEASPSANSVVAKAHPTTHATDARCRDSRGRVVTGTNGEAAARVAVARCLLSPLSLRIWMRTAADRNGTRPYGCFWPKCEVRATCARVRLLG
jgi:hypothetical protein